MKQFVTLPKLKAGDQVAVVSPSAGLPGLFPWVQDLGLERLQSEFKLKAKEYPTTRQMGSSLEDRARDLHEAFKDPANKAVISSIGGSDQVKLLKHLDAEVFKANPKPFFGYSDNTHFINFLWNLGIPAYYGGGLMNQFGMNKAMLPMTVESLKHALFETGEFEITAAETYNDIGLNWADKATLNQERPMEPSDGWHWDGTADGEGRLWGGCLESMVVQLAAGRYLPKDDELDGAVLYLESAEDIPDHWIMDYVLTGMGERGWLAKFQAILIGRPKVWDFDKQFSAEQKAAYKTKQRETVIQAVRQYNQIIPIVQNLDFGHTDPQLILPAGNMARVVGSQQKICFSY